MSIVSNALISRLVRASAPPVEKSEKVSTTYGTVVSDGENNISVKFDGSQIGTPVDSTVEVENNERVIVQIKNHKAVITGNVSNPACSKLTVKKVADAVTGMETEVSTLTTTVGGMTVDISDAKTAALAAQSMANSASAVANSAQSAANNAAKTATNYISAAADGITVGNKTNGSWVGTRSRMGNSSFDILDANGNVLSSYGNALAVLSNSNTNSDIVFTNNTNNTYGTGIKILDDGTFKRMGLFVNGTSKDTPYPGINNVIGIDMSSNKWSDTYGGFIELCAGANGSIIADSYFNKIDFSVRVEGKSSEVVPRKYVHYRETLAADSGYLTSFIIFNSSTGAAVGYHLGYLYCSDNGTIYRKGIFSDTTTALSITNGTYCITVACTNASYTIRGGLLRIF